jgi:hypothetical protein
MAGYSEQQILGLGDLAKLPYDKMDDLIVKKELASLGEAFNRQDTKMELLRKNKDKQ